MTSRHQALSRLGACLRTGPDFDQNLLPKIAEDEWQGILALANEHLLTPTLHRTLLPHKRRLPPEVWRYLDYLHVMNCRRNRFIDRQAIELVRGMNDCDIAPMLLKGVLMVVTEPAFGRGTRMMADIDLMVPRDGEGRAKLVLAKLGYTAQNIYPEGHHAAAEFARDGHPASIDLHFELVDQHYLLSAAEVWAKARRVTTRSGARFCIPSATHRILHNLVHAQIHYRGGFYRGDLDLRQLYELAYLARTYDVDIDWPFIEERLRQFHLAIPLQSYLVNAMKLFGLRWPLSRPPAKRALLHAWRCRMQHGHSFWRQAGVPWGNFRAAFAWHRMEWLHSWTGVKPLEWRYRHLRYVLGRHPAAFFVDKLFKF